MIRLSSRGVWTLALLLPLACWLLCYPLGSSPWAWGQLPPPEFEIGPAEDEIGELVEFVPPERESITPDLPAAPQEQSAWEVDEDLIVPESVPVDENTLRCRAAEQREALLEANGGTAESEAAVAAALAWLAAHQNRDGSWDFNHGRHPDCRNRCGQAGTLESPIAATGLALLAFLGAGDSHEPSSDPEEVRDIDYRETVARGLEYLLDHAEEEEGRLVFHDQGTMYTHGICTIALCEALAMTDDENLMEPAQAAVDHIVFAQDPRGGGWRYMPQEAGDTSVLGWQFMALLSACEAGLEVPAHVWTGTDFFLDSVQEDSGSRYGYTGPGTGSATSAVGLLCRMHLGWEQDHGAIEAGADFLADNGPSRDNMYFNYYATQVLFQHGGEPWEAWNETLREQLVETQSQAGHEAGSWYISGDHGSGSAGRLYCTAMNCLILETYYRHARLQEE